MLWLVLAVDSNVHHHDLHIADELQADRLENAPLVKLQMRIRLYVIVPYVVNISDGVVVVVIFL